MLIRVGERHGLLAPTISLGALDFSSRAALNAFTFAYVVIAIGLGALLYYWIEAPARNWSASLASRIGRGELRFPSFARRAS